MEKASTSERLKRIRNELIHGRDTARQLQTRIKNESLLSQESLRPFIEGLVNSCSMSISMLTAVELPKHLPFPRMLPGSRRRRSVGDNSVCKDADCLVDAQSRNNKSGKSTRMCVKRVTHVTLAEGAGLETALEDGYSWRKYGQKDILGSRYPRGYYRCTNKTTEGCLARKQIQRIDEEIPPVFKIILFGAHSCSHHQQLCNSQISSPPAPAPAPAPSIHKHDISFPDQNPHQENYILQHSGPILPSDTTYNKPVYNYRNTPLSNHVSFDVGYLSSLASSTTWFPDHFDKRFYQSGVMETDVPSAITPTENGMLHQQIEFDPFSDIVNWEFSG